MRAIYKTAFRRIAYVVAAFVIFVAVLVVTTRSLTPILDSHRADLEKIASQLLQTPVSIEKLRVSWYGYQPQIALSHVTILNKETQQPGLQINKVRIFFSIPKSIWQWKPVPSGIMVSGTELHIIQDENGQLSLQGFTGFGSDTQETKLTDILDQISQQPRLILRDINLTYTPFNKPNYVVTLFNLTFQNSKTNHVIYGKAMLHQDLPLEVTLGVQWQGEHVDLDKIRAKAYLYISGLSLPQWLKDRSLAGWQVNQGIMSAKLWTTWNEGKLRKVQSTFQVYSLDLFSQTDQSHHYINRLSGNIGWKKDQEGQEIFAGDEVLIDLPNHLWPATSFYVALSPDANGKLLPKTMNIGYLDIGDVQKFLFSSPPIIPEDIKTILTTLKPTGSLQNTIVALNGPIADMQQVSFDTTLSQVGFASWNKLPSFNNLSGHFSWNGKEGTLALQSQRTIFSYDSIFGQPVPLDEITGTIDWKKDPEKGWVIQATDIQLLNNDLSAKIKGSLIVPSEGSPVIDMNANFSLQNAAHISRYLPTHVFDPKLLDWLNKAFLSGDVKSAEATVRGPLADFPFDKGNGVFLVSGDVRNINLHYAPDWPNLQKITGRLVFSGRKMTVDAESAQLLNIPLNKIHAEIPYLGDEKPQVVEIQSSDIKADFSQGLQFVRQSPLQKTLGKMFNGMEGRGPINLKLNLSVPLNVPDGTKVEGQIGLSNAELNMVPWRLVLEDINGHLHFTEDTTDGKNITAKLFGKPWQIELSTIQKSKDSVIQADATGKLAMDDLETWLKIPFSKVAQGETDVTAQIDFSTKAPIDIQLKSNLSGVALKLPDPYDKKATDERAFVADITVQEQQPLKIQINYADQLGAALVLNRKRDTFSLVSANLHLGKGNADWPVKDGFYISGDFDELNWDKIKASINQKSNTQFSSNNQIAGLPLRGIDIRAKVVHIVGQTLNSVRLQLTPSASIWTIDITSSEVAGEIQMPANFSSQGQVTAQFDKVSLIGGAGSSSTPLAINPKTLPPITFTANSFSYNGMSFGQLSFKTTPSASGLSIRTLRIDSPRLTLQASGDWIAGRTRLQGSANTSHLSEFLNSIGLDVHNLIANNGSLSFNLSWQDAPYSPALGSLNGNASLNVGPGRIVDVGQASGAKMDLGKMLSIFSLQTIPRRLTLDFSDLFQKGYSFDSVKGDFNLQNGNAMTDNLRFDGPVAKIGINGRIGFKNKDFDLNLNITANVTSSIPVAATLITGNPVVGLAALGLNTVIGSQVTTYRYKVSGPWSNPVWQSGSGR